MPIFTGVAMPQARNCLSQARMRSGENENWLTMCTRKPLRGGGGDLFVERRFQPAGRDARMAFRIGADADLLDAGLAQAALLDHRQRVGKRPGGIDIAADHQQPPHVGFAAQAGEASSASRRQRVMRRAAIWTTGSRPALRRCRRAPISSGGVIVGTAEK